MNMTPEQERRMANVAANFFLPLEKRLGFFKPEDGADKGDVLAWWAEMLGGYAPADLLWFADHWLRTDEWGKFPRTPALVQKIMRQHGRSVAVALLAAPDPWEAERSAYMAWHAENVGKHDPHKPWWHRRTLEWALDEAVQAFAKAEGVALDVAPLAMWRRGLLPGNVAEGLEVRFEGYQQRGRELAEGRSDMMRSIGRLWASHWAAEKRDHDAAVLAIALPEKHTG